MPHDIMLDTVAVQERILSTNPKVFPPAGSRTVERWG